MEKVLLPNYGFVKTKLPKNIYSSVLKECLNMKGKEEFTSGLTEPGVTKHYYVKDNLDFDQIIWEFGDNVNPDWIHISYINANENRGKCLKAKRIGIC